MTRVKPHVRLLALGDVVGPVAFPTYSVFSGIAHCVAQTASMRPKRAPSGASRTDATDPFSRESCDGMELWWTGAARWFGRGGWR